MGYQLEIVIHMYHFMVPHDHPPYPPISSYINAGGIDIYSYVYVYIYNLLAIDSWKVASTHVAQDTS